MKEPFFDCCEGRNEIFWWDVYPGKFHKLRIHFDHLATHNYYCLFKVRYFVTIMKALSIIQPWATLIVIGAKHLETRSWTTPYRVPLLIHASAKLPKNFQKFKFTHDEYFKDFITDMEQLPYGAVIGKAELINTYSTDLLTNPNHYGQAF
jgi:hypothetical protein